MTAHGPSNLILRAVKDRPTEQKPTLLVREESWPVSLRHVPPLEALLPEQSRHDLPQVESWPVSLRRVLPRVPPMSGLLLELEPLLPPLHSGGF